MGITFYFRSYLPSKTVEQHIATIPDLRLCKLFYPTLEAPPVPAYPKRLSFFENLIEGIRGGKTNDILAAEYKAKLVRYEQLMGDHNKTILENAKIIRARCETSSYALFRVMGIASATQQQLDSDYSSGRISSAEIGLFAQLQRRLETGCQIYQQVSISGVKNPFDILIFRPPENFYVVELDGPHHTAAGQYKADEERKAHLNRMGISLFRIGFELFERRKNETIDYICQVASGHVSQGVFKKGFDTERYTWDDGYDDYDELDRAIRSEYYPNRQPRKQGYQHAKASVQDITDICYLYSQTTGVEREQDQIVDICILIESISD